MGKVVGGAGAHTPVMALVPALTRRQPPRPRWSTVVGPVPRRAIAAELTGASLGTDQTARAVAGVAGLAGQQVAKERTVSATANALVR